MSSAEIGRRSRDYSPYGSRDDIKVNVYFRLGLIYNYSRGILTKNSAWCSWNIIRSCTLEVPGSFPAAVFQVTKVTKKGGAAGTHHFKSKETLVVERGQFVIGSVWTEPSCHMGQVTIIGLNINFLLFQHIEKLCISLGIEPESLGNFLLSDIPLYHRDKMFSKL